jgi:acyl carrier protein
VPTTDPAVSVDDRICGFVIDELEWEGSREQLVGDEPVRLPEILDSASLLELASIIESEFDIEIDDDEIVPENFDTVPKLGVVVRTKLAAGDRSALE